MQTNHTARRLALTIGMAVPFLYFGIQIAAAPFFPGYSFSAQDASTLGSSGSRWPTLFNIGCLLVGIAMFVASWGFFSAFRSLEVRTPLGWTATLALISCGLAAVNAFLFPLPDPRHTDGVLALAGAGTLLLPVVLPLALWKTMGRGLIQWYFIANIFVLLTMIPIMSGLVQRFSIMAGVEIPAYQTFLNNNQGSLQRIVAIIAFGPISVGAWHLMRRLRITER